jgi:hypothetical protein
MKNIIKMSLVTAMMMSLGTVSAQAEDGISILDNIKVSGELRPRYEFVEEDNTKPNANALTNRLVLGVGGDLLGTDWLSGYAEMTDIHAVNDNYNDSPKGTIIPNSVVADPVQTRVTQSYLGLKYKKTQLRYGRQMFNIDNLRFIGAVAWRQMPQTYDATTILDSSIEGLDLMASYVTKANTVTTAVNNSDIGILHAQYKAMDALTVTGYGYLVENLGDTYGIALTGAPKISDTLTLNYRAEYAMMGDAAMTENPTPRQENTDADYYNLELGMSMSGILAGLNYEVQSGDSDTSDGENNTFSTPYGTNHKFNGFADKFLTTPVQGLVDANIMLGYKSKEVGTFKAFYHDFSSDVESIDYGTEIDFVYVRAIPGLKNVTGLLKYADYNADEFSVDTQKFWVQLDYKFSI